MLSTKSSIQRLHLNLGVECCRQTWSLPQQTGQRMLPQRDTHDKVYAYLTSRAVGQAL